MDNSRSHPSRGDELTINLDPPSSGRSRLRASGMFAALPATLKGRTVVVDASNAKAIAPGFADQVCKEEPVLRHARRVILSHASSELAEYVRRSAEAHGVADKLTVQ